MTRQIEPEWDDATRRQVEALAQHDREVCPGCGMHESILADPEHNAFTFEERLCKVCAGQDAYGRVVAEKDDWALEDLGEKPKSRDEIQKWAMRPRPGDGRHIYLRGMTPDEKQRRDDGRPPRKRSS